MSGYNGRKGNTNSLQVKRLDNKPYKFYFVAPPENIDANHMAEELMGIKDVEEVFVTDGDYGFIVKTRCSGNKPDEAYEYISKHLGNNFGKVTSYYQYKK